MAFVCTPCLDLRRPNGLNLVVSHGPCEICGVPGPCADIDLGSLLPIEGPADPVTGQPVPLFVEEAWPDDDFARRVREEFPDADLRDEKGVRGLLDCGHYGGLVSPRSSTWDFPDDSQECSEHGRVHFHPMVRASAREGWRSRRRAS